MDNVQIPQQNTYVQPVAQQPVTQPVQATAPQSGMPTASAVNIVIQNPTANAAPTYPCYPANYYTQQPSYNMIPNNAYPQAATVTQPAEPAAAAPIEEAKKEEKTEEKKPAKTKNVVQLTDDYIKTLENYLRNPNKDIRMMGAKELSKRFEEDESRRDDKALNALLNLVLQDQSSGIRMMGLALANSGLAQGDETTVKLLQDMQKSQSAYGQDALTASEALLKMSGTTVKIPDNSPDKEKKSEKSEK